MRNTVCLLAIATLVSWTGVQAESDTRDPGGNLYLGFGATSLALDNERIPGVPTSSPSHTPKIGSLLLGYRFNERWSADLGIGTDLSNNPDTDVFAVNGYRHFGTGSWRPYISAGLSTFNIDDAPDETTEQIQGGFGIAGQLSRNLELRVGYQHYVTLGGDDFEDKAIGAALAWHFREPEMVAAAEPEPEPVVVPEEKKVIQTYELQVQFDFDKSNIKSAYEPQFEEIARVLKENPDVTLMVEGHTCWIGTEKYNLGLSQRRADAVRDKFVSDYGIAPVRIDTKGYGESRPVADNNTLAGRQRNRRAIAITLGPDNVSQ